MEGADPRTDGELLVATATDPPGASRAVAVRASAREAVEPAP